MPVTKPVPVTTVATEGLLLLHVPPTVLSPRVMVAPMHNNALPEIVPAAGAVSTVMVKVTPSVPQPAVTM